MSPSKGMPYISFLNSEVVHRHFGQWYCVLQHCTHPVEGKRYAVNVSTGYTMMVPIICLTFKDAVAQRGEMCHNTPETSFLRDYWFR